MIFNKVVGLVAALLAVSASAAPLLGNKAGALENTFLIQVAEGVDAKAFVLSQLASANIPASDVKFRTTIKTNLFNGASFTLDKASEASKHSFQPSSFPTKIIEALPFVRAFRVGQRFRPIPQLVDGTKLPAEAIHSLTGVNEARAKFGLTGKGIKVAIIDSGVDYLHPALGGGFGPGYKVAYGYDLVGDSYGIADPIPTPDSDPLDNCSSNSHGTHVAGIVGADTYLVKPSDTFYAARNFTGVAPNAILGAYRVFGCPSDNTGSDIINLSLGGGPVFPDDSDAYAAEVVGKAGHYVVASNGNSQAAGLMTNGSPAVSRGGLGIASFDNVAVNQPFLTVDDAKFPFSAGQLNGAFNFGQEIEIIANDLTADDLNLDTDGTAATPTIDAKGKALLIRWGNTAFGGSVRRCNYAVSAGAVACIIYSNGPSIPGIFGSADIPSLATTQDAGRAIVAALKAGKTPKFVVTDQEANFPIATAGTVSDFSSPGLDPELFIKPDLGGIGGEVLSTISSYAMESQSLKYPYGVYSGTSMSSPYTAGALALFLESKGKLDFETVRAYLQNTAKPAKIYGSPLVDSVARQGAGLLNVYDAITTKTLVTPSALQLDTKPVTYTLTTTHGRLASGFIPGDDALQPIATTTFTADYATVKFARLNDRVDTVTLTVPASSSRSVNVHFTAPSTAIPGLFPVYSGFVKIAVAGDLEPVASVPFAGMVGSWRDAPIWVRNSPIYTEQFLSQYPISENTTASTGIFAPDFTFTPLNDKTPDTLSGTDGIIVLPIASTNSRYAKVEVLFAGTPAEKKLLPSSIPAQGLSQPSIYGWYGAVTTNATSSENEVILPSATYRVKFSALKHFGRVGSKGDSNYDVVVSPPFKLVY
ncbi:peptidase S8/S53 domain-containing protein [Chytridium lagenaria]|nr:peptidase S8/S53 domain-containing protein [Chytridium lagenaria]